MPHPCGGGALSSFRLPIQTLTSSRNSLPDTPRNSLLPVRWASLSPVKLTCKMNHHTWWHQRMWWDTVVLPEGNQLPRHDSGFPIELSWHPCWKPTDHKPMGLFLGSVLVHWSLSRSISVPASHGLCVANITPFVVSFWNQEVCAPQICSSFSRHFQLLVPLHFQNSEHQLEHLCDGGSRDVGRDYTESIHQSGEYWHLINTQSSSPRTWAVFPFIQAFFYLSQSSSVVFRVHVLPFFLKIYSWVVYSFWCYRKRNRFP